MKKFSVFLLILPFLLYSCGPASKVSLADRPWSYEVESIGVGAEGTCILRVWSYYRTSKMPEDVAKRNAVHAVIFRGVPAGGGASARPALMTGTVSASDSLFFDNFFAGDYQMYINSIAAGSRQVVKTRRNGYRIGYAVSVAKDELRKYLEAQGIVKPLSSGF